MHSVHRVYLALVAGAVRRDGLIDQALGRDARDGRRVSVRSAAPRRAGTESLVAERLGREATLLIVLDSHVLVWARADERRLSAVARRAILGARAEGGLAVGAISLYEVARLFALGPLRAVGTVSQAVQDLVDGVTVLPLTPDIVALASFPREFPRDPADRLITATARAHALPLVTAGRAIRDSPLVETIW